MTSLTYKAALRVINNLDVEELVALRDTIQKRIPAAIAQESDRFERASEALNDLVALSYPSVKSVPYKKLLGFAVWAGASRDAIDTLREFVSDVADVKTEWRSTLQDIEDLRARQRSDHPVYGATRKKAETDRYFSRQLSELKEDMLVWLQDLQQQARSNHRKDRKQR